MNLSTLVQKVRETGNTYFDKEEMRYFGDTITNFACNGETQHVVDILDNECTVYEVYRKRPNGRGLTDSVYFDSETFERKFLKEVDKA